MTAIEAEKKTCATCKHIGDWYWGDAWAPIHHCGKSDQRRSDNFKSCGDGAQDFMNEFRKFYDATPTTHACPYYEPMDPLEAEKLAVIREVREAGDRAYLEYFGPSNAIASKLEGKFLKRESHAAYRHGFVAYSVTKLGEIALTGAN